MANRYDSQDVPVPEQQFGWACDEIGNFDSHNAFSPFQTCDCAHLAEAIALKTYKYHVEGVAGELNAKSHWIAYGSRGIHSGKPNGRPWVYGDSQDSEFVFIASGYKDSAYLWGDDREVFTLESVADSREERKVDESVQSRFLPGSWESKRKGCGAGTFDNQPFGPGIPISSPKHLLIKCLRIEANITTWKRD